VPGADGLKTGHTEEAGYGFVGSAVQDGRRVIFVVTGLSSMEARRTESERILNWAFRQFSLHEVAEAGTRLGEAEVWMGAQSRVGLVPPEDLSILMPATGEVEAEIAYQGPIAAPITAGQEIASLVLRREGMPDMRIPLTAETDVPRGGLMPRVTTAVAVLMGMAGLNAQPGAADPADEAAQGAGAEGEAAEGEADEPAAAGTAEAQADETPAEGTDGTPAEDAPAEDGAADAGATEEVPAEDGSAESGEAAEGEGLQVGE
jgi:D-alanyl-D-alanine carboxypeptidase (penicillin-binding protein 5/6)